MHEKRKLLFWELCNGDVSRETQHKFDLMMKEVQEQRLKGVLTLKLTVVPAEMIDGTEICVGKMAHTIDYKLEKAKPVVYSVQVNKKHEIVNEGESITDVLQEELRFDPDKEKIVKFEKDANS